MKAIKERGLLDIKGRRLSPWRSAGAAHLLPIPFLLALAAWVSGDQSVALGVVLGLGLLVYGYVFAINSALHPA